jgi:hypothetical protein
MFYLCSTKFGRNTLTLKKSEMVNNKKLSVLLGLRDKVEKSFGNMLDDMFVKFKNKQGLFKGSRKTYTPIDGYADEPQKRGYELVASTVSEQLNWFKEHTIDYFNVVMAIEKTNASGVTAPLIVNGVNWGDFSTLELLRLKSILDGKFKAMIGEIPIRKETTIWKTSTDDNYANRDVFESPLEEGYAKTTLKEAYILTDPHATGTSTRQPIVEHKSTTVNIGQYTSQDFSGEYTNRQRAELAIKFDKLYKAVIEALETANNIESVESDLGTKVLNYFF